MKKDRYTNLSKLSKTFAVYLIQKNNMVQIYKQVVSDIEKKIQIAIFCTGCKILITLLTSTVVEYYYFGRQKMCKIKVELFLK